MTMHESDLMVEARRALGDIVEQTPMAPEWREFEFDLKRPNPASILGLRRGLAVAVASAVAVLTVVGGVALFGGPRDVVEQQPTTLGPTVTTQAPATSTTSPPATTMPPTTLAIAPAEWVNLGDQIDNVAASSELSPGYVVGNLIDGLLDTAWNDRGSHGEGAELTFEFSQPVYLDSIVIINLQDEAGLLRNFRIKELEIGLIADTGPVYSTRTLASTSEPQVIEIDAYHQGSLVIRVLSVWPSQAVDGMAPFEELAIAEIEFYGSPAPFDEVRASEIEAVLAQLKLSLARVAEEITSLEEALETASDGVAEELRDMLVISRQHRVEIEEQIKAVQGLLDDQAGLPEE